MKAVGPLRNLRQTCEACPSQWEAETVDGKSVYVRFRWGVLRVGLDGETVYEETISDNMDGVCTWQEVVNHTGLRLEGEDDGPPMCDAVGCIRPGRHEPTIGPVSTGIILCCEDMHDFMREVGKDDPEYFAGWAKWQKIHEVTCGYVEKV